MAPKSEVGVSDSNFSAFAAMRALRDQLRERLDQNEDYRAWKALDEALRDLEPRTLPQALDFALDSISDDSQGTLVIGARPKSLQPRHCSQPSFGLFMIGMVLSDWRAVSRATVKAGRIDGDEQAVNGRDQARLRCELGAWPFMWLITMSAEGQSAYC
jgi:hypothetical protein